MSPESKAISCEAKRQLAEEFAIATRLYYEMVVRMSSPVADSDALEARSVDAAQARRRAEAASTAFYEHVESHGC